MKKILAGTFIAALLTSCAPAVRKTNYDLQWDKSTARLVVTDETGKQIPAFDGKYVAVPGFVFSRGEIRMHPGKRRIGHICPVPPGDIYVLDIAPSVDYDFKAGKLYELSCKRGQPAIRELNNERM